MKSLQLQTTMDWLRPLVHTMASWDYCILWKFGDDPSRFIELVGCCCGATATYNGDYCKNVVKDETGQHLLPLCKDTFIKHPVTTIACERLAKFPSSLPLYSGVHGEVAMSNQPKWLSHESVGTQVLIPLDNATMIELSSVKLVPKDEKIIDFIVAQYYTFVQHEKLSNPFVEHHIQVRAGSLPYLNFIPSLQHLPSPVHRSSSYPSLEGSSTGSTPSKTIRVSPTKSIGKSLVSLRRDNSAVRKEKLKGRQSTGKELYQSKNLVTERNRRIRIKDGLFALRAIVPKITKMDRAAILGDAVDYIHELLKNIEDLRDELRILEEEEEEEEDEEEAKNNNSSVEFEALERKRAERSIDLSPSPTAHSSGSTEAAKQIWVQVEVNQIGCRDFLLRIVCNQTRGGFLRMMEAVISLGLLVIDANVTTCNGRVLNILKVEAKGKEVEAKRLKESLYKLVISDKPTVKKSI